jgi:hypothetical protein
VQRILPLMRPRLAAAVVFGLVANGFCFDSISLLPVADTTLLEVKPTNSTGGLEWFSSGTTQNYTRNRGLVKFDVARALPAGTRILGVTLNVRVTQIPRDGFNGVSFSLRRMLVSWGEGTNVIENPDTPGFGAPASPGDATWNHRFSHTTNTWTTPGGEEGVDYSATSSALVGVESTDPYSFESFPSAKEDVQLWLDQPELNFGWMIKCESEEVNFTARRFGSREFGDPNTSPVLNIIFRAPPRFSKIEATNGAVALSMVLEEGFSYRVEAQSSLAATNAWTLLQDLGAIAQTTNVTLVDPMAAPQRFYRIRRD